MNVDLREKSALKKFDAVFYVCFFDKGLNSRFLDLMFSSSNSCLNSM